MTSDAAWHRSAVLYQIYPRSFCDSNDDGIGDLAGITSRLDYVADLGVDGIWISPFFKSPMKDFGYDVADYRQVDPLFGGNDDFERLMTEAHRLGLKVIIDMVLCHTSDQHAWFQESRHDRGNPKADWYVWADARPDGTEPNNWLSIFGGHAWSWEPRRRQYYLHHFLREQPNLNYCCADLVEAVLGECRHWLDLGVDGFRLDAIHTLAHDPQLRDNPPTHTGGEGWLSGGTPMPVDMQIQTARQYDQPHGLQFLAALRKLADGYGDRYLLGEVGGPTSMEISARYTRGDALLHATYNFSLLQREPMSHAQIRAVIRRSIDEIEDGKLLFATSNHDTPRPASRFVPGPLDERQRSDLAVTIIAMETSLHGGACLYNGEELGLPNAVVPFERMRDPFSIAFYPEFEGRDGCRTPMPWHDKAPNAGFSTTAEPWLPIDSRHLDRAVNVQEADTGSTLQRVRRFMRWRKDQPALNSQAIRLLEPLNDTGHGPTAGADDPILVVRGAPMDGGHMLCGFNFAATPARVDLRAHGLTPARLCGDNGQIATLDGATLTIPAYGAAFVDLADTGPDPT